MTELPTGYEFRTPTTNDARVVADVVVAHDIADFGEPDFTEQDLLDDWIRPRFSLDGDAWVLSGPTGRIVGYAYVWEAEPDVEFEADAYVLPEYSGRGLGGCLIDLIEHRARELAGRRAMKLGVFASNANQEKRNLLARRGFRYARSVLRMRIDLSRQPVDVVDVPAGVSVAPFDPADGAAVRAVWIDAFSSHGRFSPRRMEEWLESRFGHPAFDPSLWRVAKRDNAVVGAVIVFDVGATGYTSSVAIREQERGHGIGPVLLRAAFDALRDRGQMRVLVSLDADAPAERSLQALYEAAGMRVHERHDLFTKPVT